MVVDWVVAAIRAVEIAAGGNPQDAARQTCAVNGVHGDVLDAETTLLNLGTYSGGLVYGEQRQLLVAGHENVLRAVLAIHETVMASRDTVQGHISQKLGTEAAGFATGEVLDLLVDSYLAILEGKPLKDAMFTLGLALEAWVKAVAARTPPLTIPKNVKTLGATVRELKTQGRFNSKHEALLNGLTAVRNAADHTMDTEIGATWAFSEDMALTISHLAWATMRSFFATEDEDYTL
jgi:hypothetical protein